ncbi:GDP/GTP exchange factor for ARF [Irineochytrium annulatum]|nr:GDP/GTP exchange factor for ARF [Irineochytrium annulatum]
MVDANAKSHDIHDSRPVGDADTIFNISRAHSVVGMQGLAGSDEHAPVISVDGTGNTAGTSAGDHTMITVGTATPIFGEISGAGGAFGPGVIGGSTGAGASTDDGGIHIQIAEGPTSVRTKRSQSNLSVEVPGGVEGNTTTTPSQSQHTPQHPPPPYQNDRSMDDRASGIEKSPEKQALERGLSSADSVSSPTSRPISPYGLPAILELLRVLVTLIDPRNRNHTDTMHRMVALGLLNVAIEIGGASLGKWVAWGRKVEIARREATGKGGQEAVVFESEEDKMAIAARELVVNELTKFLFQLLQSTNITIQSPPSTGTLTLFTLTLRVITCLFQTARVHLKLQLEWLLEWIMTKVNAGVAGWDVEDFTSNGSQSDSPAREPSASGPGVGKGVVVAEVRELLLETMVQFFKNPTFATELWQNFDGDLLFPGHMFEEVIRFLSKHSFPDVTPGGPVTTLTHQTLCLDALLIFLKSIAEGQSEGGKPVYSNQELLNIKLKKRVLREGAERFNAKPKDGIAFLQANGFLPDPVDPASLASFLKTTPSVNKTLLGDYLARPANLDVLKAFIQLYNFKGKRLDEALRLLLESFRLPGEAQQIDRILENFASGYFAAIKSEADPEIADESSTFVLAFSIILLNTDQHNPQVRRRMTKDDFKRNTRGCNDGKDFDPEYLGKVYDAIRENEIVMPEEHEGDLGFNYAWRELLKRVDGAGLMVTYGGGDFDKDMFSAVWVPTLASISYAFDNAEDNLTLQKAVVGFHSCATIASRFNLVDVLDSIIISLSKITGLLKDNGVILEDRDIRSADDGSRTAGTITKVDSWAVDFGRSYKGQVAAVLMFNLAAEYGNSLREGWKNVITVISNLFLHSLLPVSLLTADDFVNRGAKIPRLLPAKERTTNANVVRKDAGLLSTLSQFLSLASSSQDDNYEVEPTAEELDAERYTVECITACRVEELFADSRFLEEEALKYLISVISQAAFLPPATSPRQTSIRNLAEAAKTNESPVPEDGPKSSAEGGDDAAAPVKFSPSAIFLLELLVRIAMQNRDRMGVVWPLALQHISGILTDPVGKPPAVLDRAVIGLLRLIIRLVHQDDMVAKVVPSLDLLKGLPSEPLNSVAEQTTAGLLTLIKADPTLIVRHRLWDTTLHLLSATSMHPEAAKYGFEAACVLVGDGPDSGVTIETFGECVDLLISFAAAAGGIIVSGGGAAAPGGTDAPAGAGASRNNSSASTSMDQGLDKNGSRHGSPRTPRRSLAQKSQATQGAIDRAVKALDRLFKLQFKIPKLIQQTGIRQERAWFEFWLPILSGIGQQCYHPSREVRQHGLTLLQRALLSPELETGTFGVPGFEVTPATVEMWVDCFENVIFPLLEELLKPEVFKLDPNGMDETRMRASALLCKIFLQYLHRLLRYKDLPRLWVDILDFMNKYMRASPQEFLYEGVLESLKNMLLVMSTQGVFQPDAKPPLRSQHNLWEVTWVNMNIALPGLKDELFPDTALEDDDGKAPSEAPAVNGANADALKAPEESVAIPADVAAGWTSEGFNAKYS